MSWIDFWQSCFFIPKPTLTEENFPDQSGRVFIITGGYAGIGKELCKILYQKNGTIYMAGRTAEKATKAIEEIKHALPSADGRLEFLQLDLADLATIKPAVQAFMQKEARLDVLVNNAGVMMANLGSRTAQGHEMHMGTNALGHYLLSTFLTPILRKTASTSPTNSVRVCWASSLASFVAPANGMEWDHADNHPNVLNKQMGDYVQSKVGNIWLARQYQLRCGDEAGIVSMPFNPGNLHSELQRNEPFWLSIITRLLAYPTKFGAYTELWTGWSEDAGLVANRNKYVGPWGRWMLVRQDIKESELQAQFWDWCEKETKSFV